MNSMHKYINIFLSVSLACSLYLIYDLDKKISKINKNKPLLSPYKKITTQTNFSQTDELTQTDNLTQTDELTQQENSDLEYDHLDIDYKHQTYESKTSKSYLQKFFNLI
jgi:hypothetical protein